MYISFLHNKNSKFSSLEKLNGEQWEKVKIVEIEVIFTEGW